MTNYGKICRFENIHNRSTRLLFLCSPKYKVFEYEILHVCEINSWQHLNIFFHIFLKLENLIFDLLKKPGSLMAMCTKSPSNRRYQAHALTRK
jgi:hypothetical protein